MNDDKVEEAKYAAKKIVHTLREKCPYSEFSGPYFPAFGLNTGNFSVSKIINFLFFRN